VNSNRYGYKNSKYVSFWTPYTTGHVTRMRSELLAFNIGYGQMLLWGFKPSLYLRNSAI